MTTGNTTQSPPKIAVLGGGPVGTMIAVLIAEKHPVTLWLPDKREAERADRRRSLRLVREELHLAENVSVIADFSPFAEGDWTFFVAVSSRMLEDILETLMERLNPDGRHIIGIITKGLVTRQTRRRAGVYTFSQYIAQLADRNQTDVQVGSINGPSLLAELYAAHHSFFNIGIVDAKAGRRLQELLESDFIHTTLEVSPVGVEMGGILKNPIAIACGIAEGLPQCGSNLQGELIQIGFNEILRFARAVRIRPGLLLGRSGLGDLIATCTSTDSRNRNYGYQFVQKLIMQENRPSMRDRVELFFSPGSFIEREAEAGRDLVEGAYALGELLEIAAEKGVELPLYTTLFHILTRREPPEALIALCTGTPLERIQRSAGVAQRQTGLSLTAGNNFNKILGNRVLHQIAATRGMQGRIKHQSAAILTGLEKRLKRARKRRSKREIEAIPREINLWIRLGQALPEKERVHLDDLIRFYVEEIADNYQPAVRGSLLRLIAPLRFVLTGLHRGGAIPHIGGEIERFTRLSRKYSILYAPTHRSHLDSVEVALGLTYKGLPTPRYAAGINLMNNPWMGTVLKSMGAYAVDRERTRNFLYLECLTAYSTMMLEVGIPSLVYPEGTRSRTGAIGQIKTGLLGTAVEAYRTTGSEVLVVPVAVSYENVPEDHEFSGRRKHTPARDFLFERTRAYMDFGEAIPVSRYISDENPTGRIAGEIHENWSRQWRILPNHILARMLCENEFALKESELPARIEEFLRANPGNYLTRDPGRIIRRGLRTLKKRGFVWRPGRGEIRGHDPDLLRYYGAMATPGTDPEREPQA